MFILLPLPYVNTRLYYCNDSNVFFNECMRCIFVLLGFFVCFLFCSDCELCWDPIKNEMPHLTGFIILINKFELSKLADT